jgi:YYY domain-containing protein
VVVDWLVREGWVVFSWWVLVTLAGVAFMPLSVRLLSGLPDKGYTLARAFGLLLVGFVFWLLASLGLLRNTAGSMILAWSLVGGLSVFIYLRGQAFEWRAWWRENRPVIIAAEVVFLIAFVGWSIYKAHSNGINHTEKPMDLMFISSIMRSSVFPPNDGWMADYSISYYYFGYVLIAMLSTLTGLPSTTGYNLGTAMTFAMTALSAFGVAYNLVRSQSLRPLVDDLRRVGRRSQAIGAGLVAVLMLLIMGNWHTSLIEWPYQTRTAPEWYLDWTATQERVAYPEREAARAAGLPDAEPVTLGPGEPDPLRWGGWWWFRASRVLNDFDLNGNVIEGWAHPIDEFPQFSFVLSDNHPHVMALPFVLLAIGVALNLVLCGRVPKLAEVIFYGWLVGSLIFLNAWDGPIYLGVLVGAEALRRLIRNQGALTSGDWLALLGYSVAFLLIGLVMYAPFFISFRSQASGFLPNLITPTHFPQFVIMFGPFLVILPFLLIVEVRRAGARMNWSLGIQVGLVIVIIIVMLIAVVLFLAASNPALSGSADRFLSQYGGISGALTLVLQQRLNTLPLVLVLLIAIVLIVGRLFPRTGAEQLLDDPAARRILSYSPATGLALLLTGVGVVLCLVPEFIFLRDNFGTRINTIFKFYYQAWVVWSIAASFTIYTLLVEVPPSARGVVLKSAFSVLGAAAILLGLPYAVFAIPSRMFVLDVSRNPQNTPLTLDGAYSVASAADHTAITCWQQLVGDRDLIVAEVSGGAYDPQRGRVASLTGVPTILGWDGHERQWRGDTYPLVAGTRDQDIPNLYQDLRWEEAQRILAQYGIDYVFYGTTERNVYGNVGEEKFIDNLDAVCPAQDQGGNVMSVFYRVTELALSPQTASQ